MIIVDSELRRREERGEPVRVGIVGAGAMGRGITLQILRSVPGHGGRRHLQPHGRDRAAGLRGGGRHRRGLRRERRPTSSRRWRRGGPWSPMIPPTCARAEGIDVILEVTGAVEFGAGVVLDAIEHGKHVVTMNAELQGTVGPLLQRRADEAGVVLTDSDGDQPGVMMNLYRFVEGIGVRPVLVGNLKGLHDPYRNPTTQEGFAKARGPVGQHGDLLRRRHQGLVRDGDRVQRHRPAGRPSVACTGLTPPACTRPRTCSRSRRCWSTRWPTTWWGPSPPRVCSSWATRSTRPRRRSWTCTSSGRGRCTPSTGPTTSVTSRCRPLSPARSLFGDATVAADGKGPRVEVVAAAKRDLEPGEVIDGIGFYMTYGLCENAATARAEELLPMGVAEGCTVTRAVAKDQVLTYADVRSRRAAGGLPAGGAARGVQ